MKYLAFFMIMVALENTQIWFLHTKLAYTYPEIQLFFWPFEQFATPLFFLFVVYYIGKEKTYKVYRTLMWVPMILFMAAYLWIKIDLIFQDGAALEYARYELRLFRIEEYFAFLFAIFNGFYSYKVIQDFERENAKYSYKKVVAQTVWLKRILYTAFFLCFLWAFTFAFVVYGKFDFGTTPYIPSYLGFSLIVIWLGYIGYYQTRVLYERKALNLFVTNGPKNGNGKNDNGNNGMNESTTEVHYNRLIQLVQDQRIYLDSSVDLRQVSEKMEISPNYLSKIISSHGDVNFSDFINGYRIEEAKKMMASEEFKAYTILSIALEAGFNSRTAFYTSFKKQSGQTPSEFRAQNLAS